MSQAFIDHFNWFLSLITLIAQILIIALLWALWAKRGQKILFLTDRYALGLAFLVAIIATLGSLIYSEIIGYNPCKLCWFQRVFMYPQIILFGLALWRRDRGAAYYSLGLSIFGAFFAAYHYLTQFGRVTSNICGLDLDGSCAIKFITTFGYITIPMMSLSAFLLLIVLDLIILKKNSLKSN